MGISKSVFLEKTARLKYFLLVLILCLDSIIFSKLITKREKKCRNANNSLH